MTQPSPVSFLRLGAPWRRRGRSLVPLLLALMVSTGVQSIRADQYDDKIAQARSHQAQNNSIIARYKAQIAAAKDKEAAYNAIIAGLTTQIQAKTTAIDAKQAELDQTSAQLDAMQLKLDATKASLATHKRQLAAELVVIYETENQSTPIANLLSSGDFNNFWEQVIDANRIGQIEERTAAQIQSDEESIQTQRDQVQQQKEQQQQELADLNNQKSQLAAQEQEQQTLVNQLAAQVQADQVLIAQVNAANATLNATIAALEAQQAAAAAVSRGSGGGNGHFIWPDTGPITQGFGCTQWTFEPYDAGCPYPHRFHNGLDIAGPCGHNIVAADAGIAYVQPFDPYGFGNYVIIVHGNGWETLYGHMAGFAISPGGQKVGRGQLVGWEGTTGNSSGCHLHFGTNLNGQWVNPLSYLS
jgi:murein DD-endopeptidase MepM/ murein hydrolase activator NlpD